MNTAFDTIVGPDGVWTEGESPSTTAVPSLKLNEREEFALRCLNAAVNLYGVIGMDDFVGLYNGYAKDHEAPVSDEMTLEEVDDLVDRLMDVCLEEPSNAEEALDAPRAEFSMWSVAKDTPRLIVCGTLTETEDDFEDTPSTPQDRAERDRKSNEDITRRICSVVESFRRLGLKLLPEDDFLAYANHFHVDRGENVDKLVRFLVDEYGLDEEAAEFDAADILLNAREYGPSTQEGLEFIHAVCEWAPDTVASFNRLVNVLGPALYDERTWEGRGRTMHELYQVGQCEKVVKEKITDVFGLDGKGGDRPSGCSDPDEDGDTFTASDVPASSYSGPIDFKFVKEPQRRAEKLGVYDVVSQVAVEFVRDVLQPEMTDAVLKRAAVRLGCLKKREKLSALDPRAGDIVRFFALMLDDQDGVPLRCRVMSRSDTFDAFQRKAATYFENFRYTWLKILAYKAGVGCRCHDLITGEELFLVEPAMTDGDVKGRTICCGIAPMVDVYLPLGVLFVARFEDPETKLKDLLKRLEISDEFPIRLSLADQARLAMETIRGFRELGYVFDLIVHE